MFSSKVKYRLFDFSAFALIYVISLAISHFSFEQVNIGYFILLSAVVAVVLAPTFNKIKSKSKAHFKMEWIFLSDPVLI
ncbi:hypothetical protein [Persicobacter psychrovividus]|uniref:Uncharacterized protein n=1 Tax=Persicobacter psychrovividus TaxID=387638 RepID=A0ABM7VFU5_9BACT|nr:hypothetical protein PEPS_21160 [Persicobacter psychrovividus]